MIENEKQLQITEERLEQFSTTLENLKYDSSFCELSPRKQEIYRNALQGEIGNLKNQINNYKRTT